MADTIRTRAAILALLADNVTGNISAQDVRDWLVSNWPEERAFESDFFVGPDPAQITTDQTGRGWMLYSQTVRISTNFGMLLAMNASETWSNYDPAHASQVYVALAMGSYASDLTTAQLLLDGYIVDSTLTPSVGVQLYANSGASTGLFSTASMTNKMFVGWAVASGTIRFKPQSLV